MLETLRRSHIVLAAITTLNSLFFIAPAKALPFAKNCAAMQSYFNRYVQWDEPTQLMWFENQNLSYSRINATDGYVDQATCSDGYIRRSNPTGTITCKGYISYYFTKNTDGTAQDTRSYQANAFGGTLRECSRS